MVEGEKSMTTLTAELQKASSDAIDKAYQELHTLSQEIWSNPEENYKEEHAHKVLTDFLDKHGIPAHRSYIYPTGFRAVFGSIQTGVPHACVVCEYDALPEIGHACGHNLIAAVGVAAGIGLKAALELASNSLGRDIGKVTVLGSPAEEGGGGKIGMIKQGVFDGVDFALMAHPAPISFCRCDGQTVAAATETVAKFSGKACHAAACPWEGINALDAAVLAYNNIACLRQQLKPSYKVQVIISQGGVKTSIIPEEAELTLMAMAPTRTELRDVLVPRLTACLQGAAQATGCTVQPGWTDMMYENMVTNPLLADLYEAHGESVGVEGRGRDSSLITYCTDMGNVSHVVPAIHPSYYIGDTEVFNHTKPFTKLAGSLEALMHSLKQAKVLAYVAIDVFLQPHLVNKMKAQLQEQLGQEDKVAQQAFGVV